VRIDYKASVQKDLDRMDDPPIPSRLLKTIEKKLQTEGPLEKPLSGEFAGLFRIRVGDYRCIYQKTNQGYLVLRIAHRKDVYR